MSMVGLCRHGKGELGKSFESCDILLSIFSEEGPEGSDLFHGVGFCEPS